MTKKISQLDEGTSFATNDEFVFVDKSDLSEAPSGTTKRAVASHVLLGDAHGVVSGGVLSINGDNTRFDISAGTARFVDYFSTPGNINVTEVALGSSAVAVTNLASASATFVLINSAGTVVQQTTFPTAAQRRQMIYLGQLGHANNTNIANVIASPHMAHGIGANLQDFSEAVGSVNEGVYVSANGANLNLNRSAGRIFRIDSNAGVSLLTPNEVSISAQAPLTFRMRTQDGAGSTTSTLDVGNYDLAGVVTALAINRYQNMRVFQLTSGNTIIQYGQNFYNTITQAIDAIPGEAFVPLANIADTAVLIGVIVVRSNATDLSDQAQARFFGVSKFGELVSSISSTGGGIVSHSLLTDLTADDHTQYVPTDNSRGATNAEANGGNPTVKLAPDDTAQISALATASNANYDFALANGFHRLGVTVTAKTTGGTYLSADYAVHAVRVAGVLVLQGDIVTSSAGYFIGLTTTITASGGSLRVNVANATGDTINGYIHCGALLSDLIA